MTTRATPNASTTLTPSSAGGVAVLGAGKVGAAIAQLLAHAGHDVAVWARRSSTAQELSQASLRLPGRVRAAASVEDACDNATLIAFAVPTHALREVARAAGEVAHGGQIALHACRGVAEGFTLAHDIIRAESCLKKIGVLGGPLYLDDLTSPSTARAAAPRPLVAVVATRFDEVHRVLRSMMQKTHVRVHSTYDVVGVEVCGAISNVAQIAVGLADGLGLGETDQGILLTRGLVEATRIGVALGAERSTFSGLAGVGDLIPRPVTSTRRHRALGAQIGRLSAGHGSTVGGSHGGHGSDGKSAAAAVSAQKDLEGLSTVREARALGERLGLSLPLIDAVDDVLFHGKDASASLERVLSLDLDLDVAA